MKYGIHLMIIGQLFLLLETAYFGSNMWPESPAEMFCDIIGAVVVVTGTVMLCIKIFRDIKNYNK